MNFKNFEDKLANLSGFEGFSPRYTMIGKLRSVPTDTTVVPRNTSTVFAIIVI